MHSLYWQLMNEIILHNYDRERTMQVITISISDSIMYDNNNSFNEKKNNNWTQNTYLFLISTYLNRCKIGLKQQKHKRTEKIMNSHYSLMNKNFKKISYIEYILHKDILFHNLSLKSKTKIFMLFTFDFVRLLIEF